MTPTLETAIEALTDTAARLEVEGYPQPVIADALLSTGLTIGRSLQGPEATARMLRQLAQRFTGETVTEASQDQPCDDPATRPLWEAMTTAAMSLREQGVPLRKISEVATIYGLTMAAKEIGPEALVAWLEDWIERMPKEPQDNPNTRH